MSGVCPIDKLEKVVLATDGSIYSEGAVREAISLAGKCDSQLVVVTVIEANPEYAAIAPQLLEKEELKAKDILAAVKSRAGEKGVDAFTVAHEGENAWEYIAEEARQQPAELIVMGRRGRTGLARVLMGSVTARVIGHASCDVLVVPRDAHVECDRIMVAADGSGYAEAAARKAIAMAKKSGGRLFVISVAPSDGEIQWAEQNVTRVSEEAAAEGISAQARTAAGKEYLQIVEAAKDIDADLIVMGCHGHTGLAQMLMGSVTERVIGHAASAVLVACAPASASV